MTREGSATVRYTADESVRRGGAKVRVKTRAAGAERRFAAGVPAPQLAGESSCPTNTNVLHPRIFWRGWASGEIGSVGIAGTNWSQIVLMVR